MIFKDILDDSNDKVLHIDQERLVVLQTWACIEQKSEKEDQYLCAELTRQLQEMVAQILGTELDEELNRLETSTIYGVDLELWAAPLREDNVEPWPYVERLLELAPVVKERFFVVPAAIHSQLS